MAPRAGVRAGAAESLYTWLNAFLFSSQVTTLFHETGHGLQHMLTKVRYTYIERVGVYIYICIYIYIYTGDRPRGMLNTYIERGVYI